jgi:hypothetical protein
LSRSFSRYFCPAGHRLKSSADAACLRRMDNYQERGLPAADGVILPAVKQAARPADGIRFLTNS